MMSRKSKEMIDIENRYSPADTSFVTNFDPDLTPIRISLPTPPKLSLIDGYGLKPSEQYFKRLEIPERLINLEQLVRDDLYRRADDNKTFRVTGFKIQQKFWEEINKNYEAYKNEVEWINRQWWHRVHGYWFFNNGKPTYICGWHYVYLNFWYNESIKGGYPEYRNRDRKWFLFNKYIYDCKETFADIDKNGRAIKGEDGKYRMIDVGKKIFYGTLNNKQRRAGDTSKSLCIEHEIAILNPSTFAGNMSYNSDQVEETFSMLLVPAWREMPLFLKPYYSNTNRPAEEIRYDVPANELTEKGINTIINYAKSGEGKAYDGKKLCFILVDEAGKTKDINVNNRHSVLKQCLSQGNGAVIIGYCIYPSTVEEMTEEGGAAYKTMAEQSNFYYRVPETNSTITGLVQQFYSAADCLEGYVDKFGEAVMDEPTESQKKEGFTKGAKQHLQGQLDYLLLQGDPESINRYRELKRKFPIYYQDSWIGNYGGIGFDILKIDKRIAEIDANRSTLAPQRGDLKGTLENPYWEPNEESGRFYKSITPPDKELCKKIRYIDYDPITRQQRYSWKPAGVNGVINFTAGGDSFNFLKKQDYKQRTDSSKLSKGGGAVYWYDSKIDPETKPIEEWESGRFVMTYEFRPPTDDEYVDDMIKMCVWIGAYMYPETNKELLWKGFIQKGFGGYLSYDIDAVTGKKADRPGILLQNQKEDLFKYFQSHIYHRCHEEQHIELLQDAKNINSIEQLTNYDRLAAAMEALWGSKNNFSRVMNFTRQGVDLFTLSKSLIG